MWSFIKRGLILGLLFATSIFGGSWAADEERSPSNDFVETSSGVIFSRNAAVAEGVCKTFRNCWTPSSADIAIMEKDLSIFLMKSKVMGSPKIFRSLASYKRKYYGFKRGADRYILVNGLCPLYWKPKSLKFASPDRLTTDMGSCYFLVDYNVERRAFSNYYVDGD